MKTLISVDPGVSNGISAFSFSDTKPAELVWFAQFRGGAKALREEVSQLRGYFPSETWIYEDFTARNTNGFSYTTATLEPLVGIGVLMGLGIIDRDDPLQRCAPPLQYFAGGKTLPEKKKAQHRWLKEKGMWVTGKDVGQPDADDVRSSMAHAIAWLRRQKHVPTLERFFK